MSISHSNTEDNENANVRCSTRPNKGEGGSLVQLTNLSIAIEGQPRAVKKSVRDIPSTQGVNPMAPHNTKPRRGRPPKVHQLYYLIHCPPLTFTQPNPAVPIPASITPPLAPTHLVPPGTEPPLHGPQLAFGHQFGFHPGASNSNNAGQLGSTTSSGKPPAIIRCIY